MINRFGDGRPVFQFWSRFFYEKKKEKEWKMNELLNAEVYENGTVPGSSVDKTEQSSIEKINEILLRFSESGGQSTPIVVELGQELQDLRDLIDVKTDPTLLKYCAAAFPGEDRKTFKQALLVGTVIDLAHMTLFRFLPVKKVVLLITLAGEEQVLELLESRGINAASSTNGKNGIQTFKFQIDRLLDSLKSQRAAAAPKKNGIIVLGTSLERFADGAEKALGDNVATTEQEIQQLGRMKFRLGNLLETITSVMESAEEGLTE
jgi:hypothetical protein